MRITLPIMSLLALALAVAPPTTAGGSGTHPGPPAGDTPVGTAHANAAAASAIPADDSEGGEAGAPVAAGDFVASPESTTAAGDSFRPAAAGAAVPAGDAASATGDTATSANAAASAAAGVDVHGRILDRTWAHGTDVSHHQDAVDWARVSAAGVSFAFAKATEGMDCQDPQFLRNWAGMKEAGIQRGAYHMLRPEDEAEPQAEWFLAVLGQAGFGPGDLPPVLDVERVGGVDKVARPLIAERALQWLRIVEERLGVRPLLYTNPSFWKDYLEEDHPLTNYPLWLADYSTAQPPKLEHGWETWSFWQYRQDGTLDGIAQPVDLNVFQGPPAAVKNVRPERQP